MSDRPGMHPNSLKNLRPRPLTVEDQKAGQKKSAEARKANTAAKNALKISIKAWQEYKDDVLNEYDVNAVDILKVLLHRALMDKEYEAAADLAVKLAEFETPKLARVENTNVVMTAGDLSDEELDKMLADLKKE